MAVITAATALTVGAIAAGTAATASVVGGAIQSGQEHKAMRTARTAKEAAAFKVKELQDARQDIINPYAGVTDLSSMAKDLTGMMSNPFESLGVATQAAEMQAEEADISLANAQEDRDNSDISYNIAKETGGAQREAAARARRDDATAGIFTGLGSVASGVASSAFTAGLSGNLPTTKTPTPSNVDYDLGGGGGYAGQGEN